MSKFTGLVMKIWLIRFTFRAVLLLIASFLFLNVDYSPAQENEEEAANSYLEISADSSDHVPVFMSHALSGEFTGRVSPAIMKPPSAVCFKLSP